MFESIVSDLLNRVLGTYIENLDRSKLRISIWGGAVELRDLIIKQSALDELGLPVRPVYGYLDRLSLKIPWSKLYTDRWEAAVEGLTVVVVPNISIVYDHQKEKQMQYDTKMSALNRIEEAKQRKKLKNLGSTSADHQDGFVEKLLAQVIRNIQINIKDIHIRYEDSVTSPHGPFAIGVSLNSLSLQSTDANWNVGLDTAILIYKLLMLNEFLLYWTPNAKLVSQQNVSKEDTLLLLKEMLNDNQNVKPVFGPVCLTSKLELNPNPDRDEKPFSIPKAVLSVIFGTLSVALSRKQYFDLISLLESLDRMQLSALYRRFRPKVEGIKGNTQAWWLYAFDCQIANIHRIKNNWSWEHMLKHRQLVREYKALYKMKQGGKNMSPQHKEDLDYCERELDLLNITLARREVDMELEREGLEQAAAPQKKSWIRGWFSWAGASIEEAEKVDDAVDIVSKLGSSLSADEKLDLYEAIGYTEGQYLTEVPLSYVDVKLNFIMEELQLVIIDDFVDIDPPIIIKASLKNVLSSISSRTAAKAVKVKASIQSLDVKGAPTHEREAPNLIESLFVSEDVPLISVQFETNPLSDEDPNESLEQLDAKRPTRIIIQAQPLEIRYDVETVLMAKDLFAPPKNVSLQQLQAAALNHYQVVKEQSAIGLQSVIETHSALDLDIHIKSSRVLLPEKGFFDDSYGLIVLTLGSIHLESDWHQKVTNAASLVALGKDQESVLNKMRESSYEYYNIQLTDIQVIVASKNEDWHGAIASSKPTTLHLLRPLSLQMTLAMCLVKNDPNLPKFKVNAMLDGIKLDLVDMQLILACVIVNNCFNGEKTGSLMPKSDSFVEDIDLNQNVITDDVALARLENSEINTLEKSQAAPQFTEVEFSFIIKKISVKLCKEMGTQDYVSLLKISARELCLNARQMTYNFEGSITLKTIAVLEHVESKKDHIIKTVSEENDDFLFKISFCQVSPKSPEIHTMHSSIIQRMDAEMSSISIRLEQNIMLKLLSFVTSLLSSLNDIAPPPEYTSVTTKDKESKDIIQSSRKEKSSLFKKKISAKVGQVELSLGKEDLDLVTVYVKGLSMGMLISGLDIEITSTLENFSIVDPRPFSHHYDILTTEGGRTWYALMNIYHSNEKDVDFFNEDKVDIGFKLELGRPRITFIYKNIMEILSWVSHFQYAQEAVIAASQKAAQVAKDNLKDVYSTSAKIKLDILLKAPVIIVPLHSRSTQGLLFDLGEIVISNRFVIGPTVNDEGHPTVFDKINLLIKNVKMARKYDFSSPFENSLLVPLSFNIDVSRNLSMSWYHEVAEIDMNANLKAVEMNVSENDIQLFLSILRENLGETPNELIVESQTNQDNETLKMKENEDIVALEGQVMKKMSFQFNLDKVGLHLFTLEEEGGETSRDCRKEFADFCLSNFSVKLDLFSNQTMSGEFILMDCTLQDTRTGHQQGITTMLERKKINTKAASPMVKMKLNQEEDKDFNVDISVSEIVLILHLPFLLRLQKFIIQNLSKAESTFDLATVEKEQERKENIVKRIISREEKPVYESLMTVSLKIEQPDILLVEDVNSIDTSCIFMHAEVLANLRMSETKRNFSATIKNIHMYTSCYNLDRRKEMLSQILGRSELSIFFNSGELQSDSIQIIFGTLHFRLAPDTVELFMSIIMCLPNVEDDENDGQTDEDLVDWTGHWKARNFDLSAVPNLHIERAEEASIDCIASRRDSPTNSMTSNVGSEMLTLELGELLVTLEVGSGSTSIPLIKLQLDCQCEASGFYSSKLSTKGYLSLEVAYYNTRKAIWEPLLEPVEKSVLDGIPEHMPWTLMFEGYMALLPYTSSINPSQSSTPSRVSSTLEDFECVELEQPPPHMRMSITAKDPLEFTITKTFCEIMSVLSESFLLAYKGGLSVRHNPIAPYKIINKTEVDITVSLKESGLQSSLIPTKRIETFVIYSGEETNLFEIPGRYLRARRHSSLIAESQMSTEKYITVKLPNASDILSIPVTKADKRYFHVSLAGGERWGLVASITIDGGCKKILLTSCIKVVNHLSVPIAVYYMTSRGNEIERICILEPEAESFVPLKSIYTPTGEFFFSNLSYNTCINSIKWKSVRNQSDCIIEQCCEPKDKSDVHCKSFRFCVTFETLPIYFALSNRHTLDSMILSMHLRPCIVLRNLLPVALSLYPPGTVVRHVMMPGTLLEITQADMGNLYLEIEILSYNGYDWKCGKTVCSQPSEFSVWSFKKIGMTLDATLDLGMHITRVQNVYSFNLYCPFWMINKTTLPLTYKTDGSLAQESCSTSTESPTLFSFKSKSFFGKKKALLRVANGDLSEKFPLDVVGSKGAVSSKRKDGNEYKISIDIQLSGSGLTKIVTFTAFYKAVNHCPYTIEFSFVGDPKVKWNRIEPGQCLGLWPPGSARAFSLRVDKTTERTLPVHFDRAHTTLFKLQNKYGGIFAEVTESEGESLISLDKCMEGTSAALVINHLTTSSMAFWQSGHQENKIELGTGQMIQFTWDSAASEKKLDFSCFGSKPLTISLLGDGRGVVSDGLAGWATWMSGAQRIVIISEDIAILEGPVKSNQLDRVKNEIEISFHSIGLSLVNDIEGKEIMYLCMASSGVVWEHRKDGGRKFRPFTEGQTDALEKVYSMYSNQLKAMEGIPVASKYKLSDNFEVDYELMRVSKPFHRTVRRVFQPGVWMQLQSFLFRHHVHMKVNKVQMDNQMCDVMFPVVFARVAPPKSVMSETVPKPFFEMSIIQSVESPVFNQFKYFSVLIQEYHLKVELPFLYAVLNTIFNDEINDGLYTPEKYEADAEKIRQDLSQMVAHQSKPSRRDFYHYLHLSPIKMHLSFSLTGIDSGSNLPFGGKVIQLFLQSVGVTMTEIQGVELKLGYFQRANCWMNYEGLYSEVLSHYINQVVKQIYVFVLGLDVLGNPFGLMVGVRRGVEDLFYEPIQGAIEGPGEFAEGLFYGMRSFMGKTVGGAAGVFSRITGTIGKGVATLTLDEDYQKRRREQMHKKPQDGLESFARGGKGIVTGVFDGVTGVFTKPITGAKEDGVEGFFKGVGKGVVGLVTKPTSGFIDFAAGQLDTLTRAADTSIDVVPVRSPRLIGSDGVIRPFVFRHAIGAKYLREVEKGKYALTDSYVIHALVNDEKSILMASDKRFFIMSKLDLLAVWKIDWVHGYEELSEPPFLSPTGLRFSIKEARRKVLGMFGGGSNNKIVKLQNQSENRTVIDLITEAYLHATQN